MGVISNVAGALFDDGWRCCDIKDLIEEYGFTFEQAYEICSELELLEREEDND